MPGVRAGQAGVDVMERCAWCRREMTTHEELGAHFPCPSEASVTDALGPCPAWQDRAHCFEILSVGKFTKKCACGVEVRRT